MYIGAEVKGQPPSGGCVLKRAPVFIVGKRVGAAAFGRLCVETGQDVLVRPLWLAAAFGRLCVETCQYQYTKLRYQKAAAFGRLCVETSG